MKQKNRRRVLSIAGIDPIRLLGARERNIRLVEEHFDQEITVRGDEIIVAGASRHIEELTSVLETLVRMAKGGHVVTEGDVVSVIRGDSQKSADAGSLDETTVYYSASRRNRVTPRSIRQKEYVDAIRDSDVVFAIGPAGTGKTYLAMAMALAALKNGDVEKIYVSRPVVEAGENLGFLPGDLKEKIDPYIRPIFDALTHMAGKEKMQRMIEADLLEIAPLAYMRGRTLNNAFAVLDEAQNSTVMQMKMFLTRLGVNSKAVITGDITQIDLDDPDRSGLVAVRDILDGVEGIRFVTFGEEDVVRHRLVKSIIKAFSAHGGRYAAGGSKRNSDPAPKTGSSKPEGRDE